MPKSRGRKKPASKRRPPARRPLRDDDLPPIDGLVATVLRGGRELLQRTDPLDAEVWASGMLGLWFKMPLPPVARIEFDKEIRPAIVERAERIGTRETLAVLCAFASLEPDPIAPLAREAAARVSARGVEEPAWACELGGAELIEAWMMTDAYRDADAYYATFRYPGRELHVLGATINRNLGGILRDAFLGFPQDDFRTRAEAEPRAIVTDVDPAEMAAHIIEAIATGDEYLDNDWSKEFKELRAVLLARMTRLPRATPPPGPDPLNEAERDLIIKEFVAGLEDGVDVEAAREIADQCLRYSCDYSCDGDPYRWSPIEVESFLASWLPRKATLDFRVRQAMPDVLRAWVRFALDRRGLPKESIAETQAAVDRWIPEFRKASADARNFGPAKAITSALLADGVSLDDQEAVNAWIAAFNARPQHEREQLLGPPEV